MKKKSHSIVIGQKYEYRLTTLPKTWVLDLDGTLMKHNGYRTEEGDSLLNDINKLLSQIMPQDSSPAVKKKDA